MRANLKFLLAGVPVALFSSRAFAFDMYVPPEWGVGYFLFGVLCAVVVILGLRG